MNFSKNESAACSIVNLNVSNLTQLCEKFLKETDHSDGGSGDATWVLTSAFIIFTMQSGFGLLEAGKHFQVFIFNTVTTWTAEHITD